MQIYRNIAQLSKKMEKNISKIKSRIIQYAEYKKFSKRRIYLETGIANGTLDKETGLSEDNIEKFISTYTEVNIEWLITGNGNMIKNNNTVRTEPSSHTLNVLLSRIENLARENTTLQAALDDCRTEKKYRDIAKPNIAADPELKLKKPDKNI